MRLQLIKNELKELVLEKFDEAFQKFKKNVSKESVFYNEVLLISSQYYELKKEMRLNLIEYDRKNVRSSQIKKSFIDIVDLLKEEDIIEENMTIVEKDEILFQKAHGAMKKYFNEFDTDVFLKRFFWMTFYGKNDLLVFIELKIKGDSVMIKSTPPVKAYSDEDKVNMLKFVLEANNKMEGGCLTYDDIEGEFGFRTIHNASHVVEDDIGIWLDMNLYLFTFLLEGIYKFLGVGREKTSVEEGINFLWNK